MTFKVLTDDNQNTLYHSKLCFSEEPMESNLRLDPLCEEPHPFVKARPNRYKKSVSRLDNSPRKEEQDNKCSMDKNQPKDKASVKPGKNNAPKIPVLYSSSIIGFTFLMPPQEEVKNFRVCIFKMIDDYEKKLAQDPGQKNLICSVNYDLYKEIILYN